MRRIRRPSHATVIAYLALFVALGGTAMASLIITSNSQVDRGTISGHKPPSGKHPNIIAGSINGKDLNGGAVSGGKLAQHDRGSFIDEAAAGDAKNRMFALPFQT